MSERRDAHHPCYDRIAWEARPEGQSIREAIIARDMLRGWHERCHRETSPVPVPLFLSLQYIARRFQPRGDVFDRIDQLTELLDGANNMKNVKPIEVEINLLAMDALEAQMMYMHEGLPGATVIDLGAYRGK